MCSWTSDEGRARVLEALAGDRAEAVRVLADETSPEFAADLLASLHDDLDRAEKTRGA